MKPTILLSLAALMLASAAIQADNGRATSAPDTDDKVHSTAHPSATEGSAHRKTDDEPYQSELAKDDEAETAAEHTTLDDADTSAPATVRKDWSPVPFEASYRVRYQGVPFTATGTRSLTANENGDYHFRARVRAFMIRLEETSTFEQASSGELRSTHYTYDRSGIAGSRERDVTFDWDEHRIHRHDRGDIHDFGEFIYDPVSWQLALQRELTLGEVAIGDRFEYPVSNGNEPDLYLLEVIGEEEINVPAGTFRTLKLERLHDDGDDETRVWVATEHDYLLVKLEHDDGRLLTLSLEEF